MVHHSRSSATYFATTSSDLENDDDNSRTHLYNSDHQYSVPHLQPSSDSLAYQSNAIISEVPLRVHVERVVREYFATLGDDLPTDLYDLILREIELPLLTVTLEQARGNQTKCAHILGLNRGTLRKKLKTYHLMT